jgi:hypothetical protein
VRRTAPPRPALIKLRADPAHLAAKPRQRSRARRIYRRAGSRLRVCAVTCIVRLKRTQTGDSTSDEHRTRSRSCRQVASLLRQPRQAQPFEHGGNSA